MRNKSALYWIALGLCLFLFAGMAGAKAEEEEENNEGQEEEADPGFAGAPYIYTGPDTGVGVGFSIIYRDIFGKAGRDTTLTVDYTQTQYSTFSLSWDEPRFLHDNARFKINLSYEVKPARRFYGIGNNSDKNDLCNWDWSNIEIRPEYMMRTDNYEWGITLKFKYAMTETEDGSLEDADDELWMRPISEVFPDYYKDRAFEAGVIAGPGVVLFHDTRKDLLPIGGGRQEKVFPGKGGYEEFYISRYDPTYGSEFGFTEAHVDLRRYIRLFSDYLVLAVRAKLDWKDGDVPFHQMPTIGGDVRGYYNGRYRDMVATAFQAELRWMFDWSWTVDLKVFEPTLANPHLVFWWDEGHVFPDINSVFEDTDNYHYIYGVSARIVVSPSIVIRADLGFTEEGFPDGMTYSVTAGQPF